MNEAKRLVILKTQHLFVLLSLSFVAFTAGQAPPPTLPAATPAPPPAAPAQRSAADLDKLVAPIALYPDPLIATILPASVYPLEIVQAARFVANTNNLANLDAQPWDENVKAVARVPAVIQKMNDDLSWTVDLGQAFLAQDKDVMDAIQSMRAKADKAGTLQTTPQQVVFVTNTVVEKTVEQQVVVVTNTIIQIQPSNPQVIYVPTYPPTVYYPPPTYVYDPYAPLVTFAAGVAIGAIIANNCDWNHGGCYHSDVNVDIDRNVNRNANINRNGNINRDRATAASGARASSTGAPTKWQPDQSRLSMSGAPSPANSVRSPEARGWSSGGAGPSTGSMGARPSTGTAGARPSTGSIVNRPSQAPSSSIIGTRPTAQPPSAGQRPASSAGGARTTSSWQQPSAARPAQSPSVNRPSPQPSSAFGGVGSGSSARSYGNRGAASRGGGFGGGGGRGGGRR